jgi:hypothetical protein
MMTITVSLLFQSNITGLKFEPDSDNEADVVPINFEPEFIHIKEEEPPGCPPLEAHINEELLSVSSSLHGDVSSVGNFPN